MSEELTSEQRAAIEKAQYRKALKKALRNKALEEKAELKVTSLMDIFVNVLIYLLMNYSTSPVDITQGKERTLPKSTTKGKLSHTTTVGITKSVILVNRKRVVELIEGRVEAGKKQDKQASSYMIMPLYEKLKDAVAKRKKIAKYNKQKFKGMITIVADQDMSFRLLSEIMYTAGQAEFGKFKFAAIKKSGG